jgi:hypothetical protein
MRKRLKETKKVGETENKHAPKESSKNNRASLAENKQQQAGYKTKQAISG